MFTQRSAGLALLVALWHASPAGAAGPSLGYDRLPDSLATQPDACTTTPVVGVEFDFGGNCTNGSPCVLTITPDNVASNTSNTSLTCVAGAASGNGSIVVSPPSPSFSFASGGAAQTFSVSCTRGSTVTTSRICCTENRSPDRVYPVFDVRCPALASPAFVSSPPRNSTIVLSGTTGNTDSATISVSNPGDATLTVQASALQSQFGVNPATLTIPPNSPPQSLTVSCVIGAAPTNDELQLQTNDPDFFPTGPAIAFALNCIPDAAPPPRPRFNALPAPPIATLTGVAGFSTLTVQNIGDAALTLGSIAINPPFTIGPSSATVQPGQSAQFNVTCSSATQGQFNGTASFVTNDPDFGAVPATVGINCSVTQPAAAILATSPSAPGPIVLSTTPNVPATEPLLVANAPTASAGLIVTSAAFLGAPSALSVQPGSSNSIIPGDSRTFGVQCLSAAAGSVTRTLRIATNAGIADFEVSCGINAAPAPRLVSSPTPGSTISFVTPQSTPQDRALVLQNTGNAVLSVSAINGPAGPQIVRVGGPTPPFTIAAGDSVTLALRCSSPIGNTYNDAIGISSNDPTTPLANYPLSCTVSGPPPAPQIGAQPAAPGPLSFSTPVGTPVSNTLIVSNPGTGPLVISGVTGVQAPFTVSPSSATIAPGTSRGFVFNCPAATDGVFTSIATLNTNVPATPTVTFVLACFVDFVPTPVSFSGPLNYAVGNNPRGVVVADLDLDGNRDVAVVNRSSDSVSVLNGTGTGGFRLPITIPVSAQPTAIALGNLNGDGRPDLVVANDSVNSVSVILSFGPAGYASAVNVGANGPADVGLGRFNSDNIDDLVAVRGTSVVVKLGQGGTSFSSNINLGAPNGTRAVEVVDLDNDSDSDIVFTPGTEVGVYRAVGNGTFLPLQTYPTGVDADDVRAADLTRDGRIDLVVTDDSASSVTLLVATATGFESPRVLAVDTAPIAVEIADFNRDGRPDIAATGGATISVLLGKGDGRFATASTFPVAFGTRGLAAGDFDNDNRTDLVASSDDLNAVSLLINGPGRFQPATQLVTGGNPFGIVAAQFDGDGRADVATANRGLNSVDVLRGNGNGTLQAPLRVAAGNQPVDIASADFNGDGFADLVTAETGTASLFLGTGNASFQPRQSISDATLTSRVVAGDLTGDSRPDLVFVRTDELVVLRWNVPTANFVPLVILPLLNVRSAALGDFDRDGDLDLIAGRDAFVLNRFTNPGTGSFTTSQGFSSSISALALDVADFDRDGNPDVAFGSSRVNIAVGNGAGGFSFPTIGVPAGVLGLVDLAASDINGDARPDVVITTETDTGINPAFLGLLIGTGEGTLQPLIPYSTGFLPDSIAIADFNNDLAPDVAVSDSIGDVFIRLNATQNYGQVFANGFE